MLESILKKRSWTVTSAHEFRRNKQKNRALPCPNCFFACGRVHGCPIFRTEKLLELDNLMPYFDHIWSSSATKPILKTFHLIVLLQFSFCIYYETSPTAWNFAASIFNLPLCSHVHVTFHHYDTSKQRVPSKRQHRPMRLRGFMSQKASGWICSESGPNNKKFWRTRSLGAQQTRKYFRMQESEMDWSSRHISYVRHVILRCWQLLHFSHSTYQISSPFSLS